MNRIKNRSTSKKARRLFRITPTFPQYPTVMPNNNDEMLVFEINSLPALDDNEST